MRHLIIYITAMLLALPTMAKKQKELVILHTNDTHSTVMPVNPHSADTTLANRGGYLRRVNMIKEERAVHPNLLLLDSGDFSQGSAYYSLFKGDVEVGLMNLMKYDAATIGNHEFDFGIDNMVRLFKKANFPILCANYDFTGTELADIVKPWTIIQREGLKIGIFGVCPELEGLVSKHNYGSIKYLDPVKTALETATYLKKEKKCDVVICLSHLGWDIFGVDDVEMMQGTRYIDLVLGGHTHTYLKEAQYVKNLDGKSIPNDQNGKHAVWVGKITMEVK